jgi:hypothetical protein
MGFLTFSFAAPLWLTCFLVSPFWQDARIKIFNNLPLEPKSVENFKVFKRKLKIYLLHSAFYSPQDF